VCVSRNNASFPKNLLVKGRGSGERLYTLSEPSEIVYALTWSPTGSVLVSGSSDSMLRWWDLQSGECVRVRKAHQGAIQSLRSRSDGQRLASCGVDGAINVWELESGEHVRTLRRDRPYERLDITGIGGLSDAQKASLRVLGRLRTLPHKCAIRQNCAALNYFAATRLLS